MSLTIDDALKVLNKAKIKMGGNRCLILSLTGSEIEDATIDSMVIMHHPPSGYVEVRVAHPFLKGTK